MASPPRMRPTAAASPGRRRAAPRHAPRWPSLVDSLPAILFALDEDGVVTQVAGRGLDPLGVKAADVVGKHVLDLVGNDPALAAVAQEVVAGESSHVVVQLWGRTLEVHVAPAATGPGAPTMTTGPVRFRALMTSGLPLSRDRGLASSTPVTRPSAS